MKNLETIRLLVSTYVRVWRFGILPLPLHLYHGLKKNKEARFFHVIGGRGLKSILQNSGPLYIKIGQILALREDLLGKEICLELSALFSQQKAMSLKEVKKILEKEKLSLDNFSSIEEIPLGVGSIGQVHPAILKSGEAVIIKVKRLGVESNLAKDEKQLKALLEFIKTFLKNEQLSKLTIIEKMLIQLLTNVREEIDFTNEARALNLFGKRFFKSADIVIPKIYDDLCNRNVLVMEHLKGETLDEYKKREDVLKEDKSRIARLAFKEILGEIFNYGNFHADPHAGNFIVLPDGKLGLIDLGLTGNFTSRDRNLIIRAIKSFLAQDIDASMKALLDFGEVPENFNFEGFKEEVKIVFTENKGLGLEILVSKLFQVAFKFDIYVPQDTTLFIKTLVTTEGLVKSLDPEFKVAKEAIPIILSSWVKRIFS
jgi:ubiquinone biosynthesis protein